MSNIVEIKGINKKINLESLTEIGVGAEGIVYQIDNNFVIKIFKEPTIDEKTAYAEKIRRLEFFFNPALQLEKLSNCAAVPLFPVKKNDILIGYAMNNYSGSDGWTLFTTFLNPEYRLENGFGFRDTALIFMELHRALQEINWKNFLIGDLNSRNILAKITPDNYYTVRILDVDSWGFISNDNPNHSFDPSALHDQIEHPKRREDKQKGLTPQPYSAKEDWWAFSNLLATFLLGFDPFTYFSKSEDGNDRDARIAGKQTVWGKGTWTTAKSDESALRIGSKMALALHRWQACLIEGEFPKSLLLDFYSGINRCQNDKCHLQLHKSVVFCPRCGNLV